MDSQKTKITTIDEYIAMYPEEIQQKLSQLRAVIKANAPGAVERISYQMPTFSQNGNLVHFAVHKKHIGFYPAPSGIEVFSKDLSAYEGSKGAVRFPLDQPIPYDLVGRIVAYRVKENQAIADTKQKQKIK